MWSQGTYGQDQYASQPGAAQTNAYQQQSGPYAAPVGYAPPGPSYAQASPGGYPQAQQLQGMYQQAGGYPHEAGSAHPAYSQAFPSGSENYIAEAYPGQMAMSAYGWAQMPMAQQQQQQQYGMPGGKPGMPMMGHPMARQAGAPAAAAAEAMGMAGARAGAMAWQGPGAAMMMARPPGAPLVYTAASQVPGARPYGAPGMMPVGGAAAYAQAGPGAGRGGGGGGGRGRFGGGRGGGGGGRKFRGRGGDRDFSASTAQVAQVLATILALPRAEPVSSLPLETLTALDSRGMAQLLKDLSRDGASGRATELFDFLHDSDPQLNLRAFCDVFTYTAMITLCVNSKQVDRALALLAQMKAEGVERNVHTYSALMNVCIKCGQLQLSLEVYQQMMQDGCQPNVVTYNTLIDVYGKTGLWSEAVKVLERMRQAGLEPVTRTYNTLMIACNTSGQWQEALGVYRALLAAGHQPNTTTFNALISAYSKAGRLDRVMEAFQEMVNMGCERSVITYSSLISACEKAGRWELALQCFGHMAKDGCAPNVITFNSLILACAQGAQWRKAQELYETMTGKGYKPDVVTYTALISAYERGGQWRLALGAFEAMQGGGCEPDAIVYNAIVDTLWDTGISWAQAKAVLLFRRAMREGLFRKLAVNGSTAVEATLHALTTGAAIVTFYCWLADLRDEAKAHGEDSLPPHLLITSARSKHKDAAGASVVRDAVAAFLSAHGSPFTAVADAPGSNKLEAPGAEVGKWLLADSLAEPLALFASRTGEDEAQIDSELSREEEVAAHCKDAFEAVEHFEGTYNLKVQAMSATYLDRRRELLGSAFDMAAQLKLDGDSAHDGALLMDRTMSASLVLPEQQLLPALVACMLTAAAGGQAGQEAQLSAAAAAELLDLPEPEVAALQERIKEALSGDCSMLSALRCLKLYLERVGVSFLEDGSRADKGQHGETFSLVHMAALDTEFLNYRPSITAAAVLYCCRLQRGLLPFWPSALAGLTGYSNAHTPELAAAISGTQRLYHKMKAAPVTSPLLV